MFKFIASIRSAWALAKWLRQQKQQFEQNTEHYLSEKRALRWRLDLEKMFYALETGNRNALPRPLRWLCGRTEADNRIGWFGMRLFGMRLLKSTKLNQKDSSLKEPIKP